MLFYRNHYRTEGGSSEGYEWFTNKGLAARAAHAHDCTQRQLSKDQQENPETTDETDFLANMTDPAVEPIEIELTKAGILDALNSYAAHADNG